MVLTVVFYVLVQSFWSFVCNDTMKSKKEGKDQESIQPSTTPDPGYQWEIAWEGLSIQTMHG